MGFGGVQAAWTGHGVGAAVIHLVKIPAAMAQLHHELCFEAVFTFLCVQV